MNETKSDGMWIVRRLLSRPIPPNVPKIKLNNGQQMPGIGFGTWLVSIELFCAKMCSARYLVWVHTLREHLFDALCKNNTLPQAVYRDVQIVRVRLAVAVFFLFSIVQGWASRWSGQKCNRWGLSTHWYRLLLSEREASRWGNSGQDWGRYYRTERYVCDHKGGLQMGRTLEPSAIIIPVCF